MPIYDWGAILFNASDKAVIYSESTGDISPRNMTMESRFDITNMSSPFHFDIANRTESIRDSLSSDPFSLYSPDDETYAWQLYGIGIDEAMANLVSLYTERAIDSHSIPLSGSIVTDETRIQVRWPWLLLPWLLNVATVILLVLTIWKTRREQVPLWKTSFLTALLPLLEDEQQTASRGDKVSEIGKVAQGVNVVLDDYDVNGRLRLRKVPQ